MNHGLGGKRIGLFAVLLVLAAASAGANPALAASGWSIEPTQNPAGASQFILQGVSCASASACTAGGDYGGYNLMPLADRWNGSTWSIQNTPNPAGGFDSFLLGVSCPSASACTAVGDYNNGAAALAEGWNGSEWSIQPVLNPSGAAKVFLLGVSCWSASACIAVGDDPYATLAERWNGSTWSIQNTPNPSGSGDSELHAVSCWSASACTAVGDYFEPGIGYVTLAERWNGTKWSIQNTPNPTGESQIILDGVSCPSASVCTATGNYFNGTTYVTLAERWKRGKWSIQPTPNPSGSEEPELLGVSCTSTNACTAVGDDYLGPTPGWVTLAERWNGSKWSIQPTPNQAGASSNHLNGVSCASSSVCTAVGAYQTSSGLVPLAEQWNAG